MESFKKQQILMNLRTQMRILGSHYNMKQKEQEKKLFNGTYRKLKALEMGPSNASVDPTLL